MESAAGVMAAVLILNVPVSKLRCDVECCEWSDVVQRMRSINRTGLADCMRCCRVLRSSVVSSGRCVGCCVVAVRCVLARLSHSNVPGDSHQSQAVCLYTDYWDTTCAIPSCTAQPSLLLRFWLLISQVSSISSSYRQPLRYNERDITALSTAYLVSVFNLVRHSIVRVAAC